MSKEVRGSPRNSGQPPQQCSDSSTVTSPCSTILGSSAAAHPAATQLTVEVASSVPSSATRACSGSGEDCYQPVYTQQVPCSSGHTGCSLLTHIQPCRASPAVSAGWVPTILCPHPSQLSLTPTPKVSRYRSELLATRSSCCYIKAVPILPGRMVKCAGLISSVHVPLLKTDVRA